MANHEKFLHDLFETKKTRLTMLENEEQLFMTKIGAERNILLHDIHVLRQHLEPVPDEPEDEQHTYRGPGLSLEDYDEEKEGV